MFKYLIGADIPLLMRNTGMTEMEVSASLEITHYHLRRLMRENTPLNKRMRWALWGLDRYVRDCREGNPVS